MNAISLTIQTLYAELLERCRGSRDVSGSLYVRSKNGIKYSYLKSQVAQKRFDVYLGRKDDAETEVLLQKVQLANETHRHRRQLVQLLRRHLPAPLPALAHVVEALSWGGILDHAVLVGTSAYLNYPALVGRRLDNSVMGTEDADVATLDMALTSEHKGYGLEQILKLADGSFHALPSLHRKSLPSRFASKSGYRVDILTQQRGSRSEAPIALPGLHAAATPLQHLAWLIDQPAHAVLLSGSGLLIQVPQPQRFAVHKLIVAQKRSPTERLKRQKDLLQAESLFQALRETDPRGLDDALEDACARGKKGWASPIRLSLQELGLHTVFS